MTREEAIKELSYIIDEMPSMECADWIEAISMGIKALAQEPCTNCISRLAVLDTISELNAISFYEAQEDSKECYYEIRNAIKQLPPVTLAEKVGQWVRDDDDYEYFWRCNKCNKRSDVGWEYCPNCGAKMQEVSK